MLCTTQPWHQRTPLLESATPTTIQLSAGLDHPDAPLGTPRLAELLKPTQGLIRAGNGGCASSPLRSLVSAGSTQSLCGLKELSLGALAV